MVAVSVLSPVGARKHHNDHCCSALLRRRGPHDVVCVDSNWALAQASPNDDYVDGISALGSH